MWGEMLCDNTHIIIMCPTAARYMLRNSADARGTSIQKTQMMHSLRFLSSETALITLSTRVLARMRVLRSNAVFQAPLVLSHGVEPTPRTLSVLRGRPESARSIIGVISRLSEEQHRDCAKIDKGTLSQAYSARAECNMRSKTR